MNGLFALIPALILGVSLLVTALVLVASYRQQREARALASWPSTPGTLLEVRLVTEKSSMPDPDRRHMRQTPITLYSLTARYRYATPQGEREGRNVFAIPESSTDRASMERQRDNLKSAGPVAVHVNPDNAAESYLIPPTAGFWQHLKLGLLMTLLLSIASTSVWLLFPSSPS